MICKTFALGTLDKYKYVVVFSAHRGALLLSRHRRRDTWETQGGHIEPGESPMDAARRELYEESGALEFQLRPVCDYWAKDEDSGTQASGQVFFASIQRLGPLPPSEMAQVRSFPALPEELTYPGITPVLFQALEKTYPGWLTME